MIFRIENGEFAYEEGTQILHDINIEVPSGRILAVLGPNGAGKTTLLKCMMGLLTWKSGKTTIDGIDMRTMTRRTVWKRMAYVPQTKGLPLAYTGEEMVVLGRSVHLGMIALPKQTDYEKAYDAMEQVGIGHLQKKICANMSGGEFQMVLIARALVAEPELLILDEPESNLDFKNQFIVLETMKRLVVRQGISCIFNTHFPDHALKIADDALLLDKHGGCFFGKSSDIVCSENMRKSFEVNVRINHMRVGSRNISTVIPISIVQDDTTQNN